MFSFFPSDEKVALEQAQFIKHAIDVAESELEGHIPDIEKQCQENKLNEEEIKEVLSRVKSRLIEFAIQKALDEIQKFKVKQDEYDLADKLTKERKVRESEDQQALDKIDQTVEAYLQKNHNKLSQVAKNAGLTEEESNNVFQKTAIASKHKLLDIYHGEVSKIDKKLTQQDFKEAVIDHLMKCMEETFKEHINIYRKYTNTDLTPEEVTTQLHEALHAAKLSIKDKLLLEFKKIDSELNTRTKLRHFI